MKLNNILKWIPALVVATTSASAWAHGYVVDSRGHKCDQNIRKNLNCGQIQYEPHSLEGTSEFPSGGPADGRIASAGRDIFAELNVQNSTRWHKSDHEVGKNMIFTWNFTANHNTRNFRYYVTKPGWNPGQPLIRASFNLTPFCSQEFSTTQYPQGATIPKTVTHTCPTPSFGGTYPNGHHVVLAVWRVGDTANSFYNVIDLNFKPAGGGGTGFGGTDSGGGGVDTGGGGTGGGTDSGGGGTVDVSKPTLLKQIVAYDLKVVKAGDEVAIHFAKGDPAQIDYTLDVKLPITAAMLSTPYGLNAALARAINSRYSTDLVAGQMDSYGKVTVVDNAPNSIYRLPLGKITGVEFTHVAAPPPPTSSDYMRYDRTRTAYKTGDVVSHTSSLYQCKVPSWCAQNAYAPGGIHEVHAWTKLSGQISYDPASQATAYANGRRYFVADIVSSGGKFYSCKVAGWCGVAAYAPGGIYSSSAWGLIK